MHWNLLFSLSPALGAVICGSLSVYTWRVRALEGARTLSLFAASAFVWCALAVFEYLSVSPLFKILFSKLEYLGAVSVPLLWLLFAAHYTRRDTWVTKRMIIALGLIPCVTFALVVTNEWHKLIWSSVGFQAQSLIFEHGPWFNFVHIPYSYTLILLGMGFLALSLLTDSPIYRIQTSILLLAGLFPALSNFLYLILDARPVGFDPTLLGIALGSALLVYGLIRADLIQVAPMSYRTVFLNTADGVVLLTNDNRITDLNPVARDILNLELNEVRGEALGEVAPPYHALATRREEDTTSTIQGQHVGYPRYFQVRVKVMHEGKRRMGKIMIIRDITTEKHQQAELERIAYLDSLTGLPNRRQLTREVDKAISLAARYRWNLAFLYIDLDKFKLINDTYGHDVGDGVLGHVATCLKREVREGDTVARLGGDEFAALIYNADRASALETCQRLLQTLAQPVKLGDHQVKVEASIGVASYPKDGATMADLLRYADTAMYRAKGGDSGIEFYRECAESTEEAKQDASV